MKLIVRIDGVKQVSKKLNSITAAVKSLEKPFEEIGKDWMKKYDDNFPAEGGVLKQPWKPRIRAYAWPILQKTGKLRAGFKKKVDKSYMEIANRVKWAQYHQFGTARLPVRRLINATSEMVDFAVKKINDYLRKIIK